MSRYACIYFNEEKILLSKVRFEAVTRYGAECYNVYVPMPYEMVSSRQWEKLEDQLLDLGIEEVILTAGENPFEMIALANGEHLRRYMSGKILEYIYKYKLIPKSKLYANIGIIPGRIDETLEVVAGLLKDITSLTFFIDEPIVYKEVIRDIYKGSRLQAKAKVPCSQTLKEMDIVFDLSGGRNLVKWCRPTAIYIDYKDYIGRYQIPLDALAPNVWYDFEVTCDRERCEVSQLEAALHAQGYYKVSMLDELRRMRVSVSTIHTRRIS